MLKKSIKYTDYNGIEREDVFFFHLTKAELMEMQMETNGSMVQMLQGIIDSQDAATIVKYFKEIILKSYGEKSLDGKQFIKTNEHGVPLSIAFSQTEAFSELFVELSQDDVKAIEFVKGIMPADINITDEQIKQIQADVMKQNQ